MPGEVVQNGEVALSSVAPAQEKGVSNGLGLETLFQSPSTPTPKAPAPKPKVTATTVREKAPAKEPAQKDGTEYTEHEETKSDGTEKKEAPARDAKTGRFLPVNPKADPAAPEEHDGAETVETLKKRLKDTRDYATRINNERQADVRKIKDLEAQVNTMAKKLDGSYVETKELTEAQRIEAARIQDRVQISQKKAWDQYGKEYVQSLIFDEGSPYRKIEEADPYVKARVFGALEPVEEAIKVVKEKVFHDRYGTDPDQIYNAIAEEVKAEILAELGTQNESVEVVRGLSQVRHVPASKSNAAPTGETSVNLNTIFPLFHPGSF